MPEKTEFPIPAALYHAELGRMVADYVERIDPAVLQSAIESRAVQTLEAIRCILDNGRLDDQACCQRIDSIVALFFQEMGIASGRRPGQEQTCHFLQKK